MTICCTCWHKTLLLVVLVLGLAGCGSGGVTVAESPEAIATALESPAVTEPPEAAATASAQALSWSKAISHVGETATIEGGVAGTFYDEAVNGEPTFLNVGRDYPDPDRFVVVIWGEDRSAFPEPPEAMYEGATIRVTGLVSEYDGCAQMQVTSPSAIEVVD